MQIHEQLLFPNFFYTTMLDDINQSNIKKFIFDIEKNNSGRTASNAGGWQNDLKDYKNNDIDMLIQCSTDIGQEVANSWQLESTIVVKTMWANINRTNNFNHPHFHPGSLYSGIYYVDAELDSGDLVFNRPDLQEHYIDSSNSEYTEKYFRITPKTNLFVLFPSYLHHYVEPNRSDTARISIAINFGIE